MASIVYTQIWNHIARYCHVADRGSAEDIAALFWEDAVLEFEGTFQGAEAIQDAYATWIAEKREPVEGLRHLSYLPAIELADATAIAETYFDADGHLRSSGKPLRLRGLYVDVLERRGAEWKFVRKRIEIYRRLLRT